QTLHKSLLHVRYKKKFVAPEDCYYNFPIPHLRHDLDATVRQSEKESVATPPVLLTTIDLSSGSSQEDIEPIPAHLILKNQKEKSPTS
ncbi:22952_t:CDS:2, partial [Rhizophagus irregularis]